MRSRGGLCALAVVAACGRVGFTPSIDGASSGDVATEGVADVSTDANPPSLCGGGVGRVCDGFEGPGLDPRWMLDVDQGSATIVTTKAYRGTSSLFVQTDQITTPTQFPRASVRSYDGLPVTGTVYVRVFIFLPTPAMMTFDQFVNFSNASGQGVSMGIRNGKIVNNDYSATQFRESATAFPLDRWACLQMTIPSDTTGTIREYIDGVEITDAAIATGGTPHPRPTHLYLGIDWPNMYTTLPPSSAWFDELLIDDAPLTCTK
jgi:hypothetical protein